MNQMGFSELEFAAKKKRARRPGALSGPDRNGDALGAAGGADRAVLAEGRAGSATDRDRAHAAHVHRAAVLRVGRRGDRGRGV